MKLFAHRGWSAGEKENTLNAFMVAVQNNLDGVEFDIRYGSDKKTIVLSHDATVNDNVLTLTDNVLTLTDALDYLADTSVELLIEFKEYNADLYREVVSELKHRNLITRSTIFAFEKVARDFPWGERQGAALGIIAPYPQDIKKFIEQYNPNMVLMGWGTASERIQFKTVWTFVSLRKIFKKYSTIKFVIGVMYSKKDKIWLEKQAGLYGATADFPLHP